MSVDGIGGLELPDYRGLSYSDVSSFIDKYDRTSLFRQQWGQDYFDKALELWSSSKRSLEGMSIDELIFSLAYNFAVSPYFSKTNDMDYYVGIFAQIEKLASAS